MRIQAVIFDLDGVLVHTDRYHYEAWQQLADEEGISFDVSINDRLRGVSRMESLDIILEKSLRSYTKSEKEALADRKNGYYRELLHQLTPSDAADSAVSCIDSCRRHGVKIAIGSSSRNTPIILERIGLAHAFDAIADGNQIARSKPDPEVFLLAAQQLGVDPAHCLVVEDAEAGLAAAERAGMSKAAIGAAYESPLADFRLRSLAELAGILFE
ncbi:beta-phosphoglucomutase [Paenibacillus marchantiophytorum]|uniref:Beta-phosphoglucomutase n=1 Tax=Paenibacillus marchantiophytorum TaxID=1619310 RepID=A0ABQ1FHJ1_9BACL|nr:beta-phosphoglucomutase [Paenibacillus marchantiophytorum]GGA13233.1 beta-phosphoglucomutase [Paenibacillus marchantiophytorum]